MRSLALAVLAIVVAGCSSGGSSSSNSSSAASSTAPESASAAPAENAPSGSIPVYPGAAKYAMGNMTLTKCGHKATVQSYTVQADVKTVTDWYADKVGGVHVDVGRVYGTPSLHMESNEYILPDGSGAVAVTQAHFPAGVKLPGTTGNPVMIGIGTYDPPFSADELASIKNLDSDDAATRDAEKAKIKAKCGNGGL